MGTYLDQHGHDEDFVALRPKCIESISIGRDIPNEDPEDLDGLHNGAQHS